jgi:RNA polymerase sigma factor FliA
MSDAAQDTTIDQRTVDALVTEHLYLIQHIVHQLASRYPRHVDRSELWSAGALGLVDAARRYDPDTGIPFARYASIRIRGAIIDSTRTRDWASRQLRREMRRIQDADDALQARLGRTPETAELAAALNMSVETLNEYRARAAAATLLHLDRPNPASDSAESGPAASLYEQETSCLPEDSLEQTELIGTVRTAVAYLPEIQQEVVRRSFFEGELLRDIADSMGVTEARVSQIRSEAITSMRAYFATTFDEVEAVPDSMPGSRRRTAYVAELAAQSTWRSRLDAAGADVVRSGVA